MINRNFFPSSFKITFSFKAVGNPRVSRHVISFAPRRARLLLVGFFFKLVWEVFFFSLVVRCAHKVSAYCGSLVRSFSPILCSPYVYFLKEDYCHPIRTFFSNSDGHNLPSSLTISLTFSAMDFFSPAR